MVDSETVPVGHRRPRRLGRRARTVEAAAVAGIVFAILSLAERWIQSSIPIGDDAEIAAWYNEDGNQILLIVALNLTSLATVAFLWFVAVIRRRIGHREDQFFSTVFVGSGLVLISSTLVATAAMVSPAVMARLRDDGQITPDVATVAVGLGTTVASIVAPRMQAVFIVSTSTVVLRSRALPSWLAYLGYVIAVVKFVVPFVIQPMNVLFPAWVLLASIVMLLTRATDLDDATPRDPPPTTPLDDGAAPTRR